jgi:cellulose synthase/poly-beta-1,6-N-acetylglucosamine synthase-like glycosyltransferase
LIGIQRYTGVFGRLFTLLGLFFGHEGLDDLGLTCFAWVVMKFHFLGLLFRLFQACDFFYFGTLLMHFFAYLYFLNRLLLHLGLYLLDFFHFFFFFMTIFNQTIRIELFSIWIPRPRIGAKASSQTPTLSAINEIGQISWVNMLQQFLLIAAAQNVYLLSGLIIDPHLDDGPDASE